MSKKKDFGHCCETIRKQSTSSDCSDHVCNQRCKCHGDGLDCFCHHLTKKIFYKQHKCEFNNSVEVFLRAFLPMYYGYGETVTWKRKTSGFSYDSVTEKTAHSFSFLGNELSEELCTYLEENYSLFQFMNLCLSTSSYSGYSQGSNEFLRAFFINAVDSYLQEKFRMKDGKIIVSEKNSLSSANLKKKIISNIFDIDRIDKRVRKRFASQKSDSIQQKISSLLQSSVSITPHDFENDPDLMIFYAYVKELKPILNDEVIWIWGNVLNVLDKMNPKKYHNKLKRAVRNAKRIGA